MSSSKNIYLDYAAATPLDPAVLKAMLPFLETEFANPSSVYASARVTRQAVNDARATIADVMGVIVTEIIFTSGGTESNNLAIQGVLKAHPGAAWVTTAIEHDAVLELKDPMETEGHRGTIVGVKPNGIVDVDTLMAAVDDDTVLVSVMLASNEIGTVQPLPKIAQAIALARADRAKRGIDLPLYLHTDACQAAGYLDLHINRLGVDLLTLNGSKLYGPKGTGLLYVNQAVAMEPLMYGGGQERGRRSGTENIAGVVGLAKALEISAGIRASEARRLAELRDYGFKKLQEAVPSALINGDTQHRLPNNLNLTIPGAEGEALVLYLDKAGFQVSTGSACSSGDVDPSHVLRAIGRSRDEANQSLRITMGRQTTQPDIEELAAALPAIVARLREL